MNAAGRAQSAANHLRRRHKMQRVADDVARVTVVGMIVVSVLLLLLPLAMTLSMSFDARDYLGAFPPPELSLRWDAKFFSDPYLLKGLSTSLELAALTALAASVLGLSAAVALNRLPSRHVQLLISLFLSPLIVPGVVIGFALLICYARGRAQSLARTRHHLSGYLLRWHRRLVAQKWNFTHPGAALADPASCVISPT
jgi:ABC-type spermidine/putrescine transport system permease subunit II